MRYLFIGYFIVNFLFFNLLGARSPTNYLLNLRLKRDQLKSYQNILTNFSSNIDEIISPIYVFDKKKSNLKAEWFLYEDRLNEIESHLRHENINFTVIEENLNTKFNLQKSFRSRRKANSVKLTSDNIVSDYYSLQQIYDWFGELKEKYPNIFRIIPIGKTLQNRDIVILKIGHKNPNVNKKFFWFDFGIHSREWTSIATSLYFIKNILEEQEVPGSMMDKFLNLIDIHILAVGNPDGYVYSRTMNNMWRKNLRGFSLVKKCFGVDLNRNFDFDWNSPHGSSSQICNEQYAGTSPTSEPETLAIEKYITANIPRWLSFISVHSFGAYWIFNRDNDKFPKMNEFIDMCEKALIAKNKIKETSNYDYSFGTPIALIGYAVSGALDTWAQIRTRAKYAYSIELAPNDSDKDMLIKNLGFWVKRKDIEFIAKGFYAGIREYFRSFMEPGNRDELKKLRSFCADEYKRLRSIESIDGNKN